MALAVVATAFKLPGSVLVAFVLLDVLRRTPRPLRSRALAPVVASGLAVSAAVVALCPDPFGWVRRPRCPGPRPQRRRSQHLDGLRRRRC